MKCKSDGLNGLSILFLHGGAAMDLRLGLCFVVGLEGGFLSHVGHGERRYVVAEPAESPILRLQLGRQF